MIQPLRERWERKELLRRNCLELVLASLVAFRPVVRNWFAVRQAMEKLLLEKFQREVLAAGSCVGKLRPAGCWAIFLQGLQVSVAAGRKGRTCTPTPVSYRGEKLEKAFERYLHSLSSVSNEGFLLEMPTRPTVEYLVPL